MVGKKLTVVAFRDGNWGGDWLGMGTRELLGEINVLCLDRGIGYRGISICKNLQMKHLRFVHFIYIYIHILSKICKNYKTLVNDRYAEIFKGETYLCLWLSLKCIKNIRCINGCIKGWIVIHKKSKYKENTAIWGNTV